MDPEETTRRARRTALLIALLLLGGCGSGGIPRMELAPNELGDSLVLERRMGFSGGTPAYRVRLRPDGHVLFTSWSPPDSGRTEQAEAEPAEVENLIELVAGMQLDSVPQPLMGRPPFCSPVEAEASSATILWFRPNGVSQVHDYLGCLEDNDRSDEKIIRKLRTLEEAIDSVAGVARWVRDPIPYGRSNRTSR